MAGYQPYPEYKESGVVWLGKVPKHWKVKRIKNLATYNDEALDEGTDPDFEIEYVDISSVNLVDGITSTEVTSFEKAPSRARRKVKDGDTIVSTVRTYLKAIAAIRNPPENLIVSTGFAVIRPKPDIYSDYLGYLLQSEGFVGDVVANSVGVSYPAINASVLAALPAVQPAFEEQQTIARFLDQKTAQIDTLISKKEALLERLAEKRTALISHAVTKGLNPQAKMKDSGVEWLGQVPAHWMVKKLKFFVAAFGGGTPNTSKAEYWDGDIPWVSPKDMKSETINETEDYLTELGVRESATKIVPIDSVLVVVRSGILRHTIPVARNSVVVSLNQDMKALIPNDQLEAAFLHRLIQGNQKGLLPLWSKPGCTVESIEYGYMANTEIGVPPLDEQRAIVEYIDSVLAKLDRQINKASQAIEKLMAYRSALITQAVTGKIDVRDFKPSVASAKRISA